MSLANLFRFRSISSSESELPEIFPLSMGFDLFVRTDLVNIYSKILTDCVERTQGIPEDISGLLWDNCLQNEATEGLITLLACAMTDMTDLFLVYIPGLGVMRKATTDEVAKIKEDFKKRGESKLEIEGQSAIGIYVSFKNYRRTDMLKLYSSLEYCVVASLNKSMNLSKAIQLKMSEMRSSVSAVDSSVAIEQAKAIANALARGKDILLDKNDEIATSNPDISAIKEGIMFLDSKRCFYLGLPLSYVNGEQTNGIGSTGEADTRAVERGLKHYYISILKPVLEALFDISTSFKSNDFRQIGSALEAMKTFDLTGDDLLSREDKQLIISRLFDIENE